MRSVATQDQEMTPEEQAGAWCARLAVGELPFAEQAEFDRWIQSDSYHGKLLDQALSAWQGLTEIANRPEIIAQRADALEALRCANRSRWSRNLAKRWQWGLGWAAVAAVVLAVFSFGLPSDPEPRLYATSVGERRIITLDDGSRLSLDADTRLSVLYDERRRALTLHSGRAKFEVAKSARRPFTVTAGGRTTVATGTSFSVELLARKLRVVLYEGRVNVVMVKPGSSSGTIALVPGEELVTDISRTAVPTVAAADVAGSQAWESGQLNFVDEPLASAVEQFNRYSSRKIVVGDDAVAAIRINGVFNPGDSSAFVDAIEQVYPVHSINNGDETVVLLKK